ncbi:hypothetical protein GCM10022226_31850 [Sphaerisporangium flaviroseum]|uniref:HAD family phosphatase n=1 Tax=Sphaerisporangium flaviroseum TaxID=509199 RepID=A0ABP7I477_9ACTN
MPSERLTGWNEAQPLVRDLLESVRQIIWDFDGVIADTEPVHRDSYERTLRDLGKLPATEFFMPYIGRPEPEIWSGLRRQYGLKHPVADLMNARHAIYGKESLVLEPSWFVRPLGEAAKRRGIPNTIVSSGNERDIGALLAHWGIGDLFDRVLGWDSPQSAGRPKDERLRALLTDDPHSTLVIEDHPVYLALAARLGARTVAVHHTMNDLTAVEAGLSFHLVPPG